MTIIESVAAFIKSCPLLKKGKINANYLSEKASSYAIDNIPSDPVLIKYPDGGSKRQFIFIFASRELYGAETVENFRNSGFYEAFGAWIEEQDNARNLPQLGGGLVPLRIEVLSGGYLFDENTGDARYQIQLRLIYYKGAI